MTCDVYESERDPRALVVVPAGAATTTVPEAAGLGELSPFRIAVELGDLHGDASVIRARAAEIESRGYAIVARSDFS